MHLVLRIDHLVSLQHRPVACSRAGPPTRRLFTCRYADPSLVRRRQDRPGQPLSPTYQAAEVSTDTMSRAKSRTQATGRNHPGARRDRTATTFTTTAPTTAQPSTPWTTVRVDTSCPPAAPLTRPRVQRQW